MAVFVKTYVKNRCPYAEGQEELGVGGFVQTSTIQHGHLDYRRITGPMLTQRNFHMVHQS